MNDILEHSGLKKILSVLQYGKHIRPARDWFILLGIMVVALLASVGYNVWLLLQVQQGEAIGETPVPTSAFNTAPLEAVSHIFEVRSEEQKRIRTQYRFVDPSRSGS